MLSKHKSKNFNNWQLVGFHHHPHCQGYQPQPLFDPKNLTSFSLTIAAQLKNGNETTNTADAEEVEALRKQVKELEKANAKAEYRIQFLLRALDERDNRQQ